MPFKQVRETFYDSIPLVKLMSTDFDKQWAEKDPILFPTAAADSVI